MQNIKYNNRKNIKIVDYYYIFGDKFMLINKVSYKLKTTYKKLYAIFQTCTNDMVMLQIGYTIDILNICQLKTYINSTNF